MTHISRTTTTILALLAAAALAVALFATLAAAPAGAVVEPKNCKIITVKGKRYNIKSDQLSCRAAREYSARFLRTGAKPRGYKCYRYRGSKIVFRCMYTRSNPDKTFFGIKR